MYCVGKMGFESELPVRFIMFYVLLGRVLKVYLLLFQGLAKHQGISRIKSEDPN